MDTVKDTQTALDDLASKMADKGLTNPSCDITIRSGGRLYLYIQSEEAVFEGSSSKIIHADNIFTALALGGDIINALPSPEEVMKREYLSRVAKAVDYATEHSLPDEYVAPLRGVSVAMTSNLLTHEDTP